jgi:hypothetical protein
VTLVNADLCNPPPVDVGPALRAAAGGGLKDPARFDALLRTVYGDHDPAVAEAFYRAVVRGDDTVLPRAEFVARATLLGGNGARDDHIYLAEDLKANPSLLRQTVVEEVGHHLDTLLKPADTPRDEGELFRHLVAGEKLDPAQLAAVRAKDDHGIITVRGRTVAVESFLGSVWDTVTDVASDIGHTAKQVGNAIVGGIPGAVGGFASGLRKAGEDLLHGNFRAAGKDFRGALGHAVAPAVDTLLIAARAVTDVLRDLFLPGRELTARERDFLHSVYGDGVDLGAIRIYTADPFAYIGRDHTVGTRKHPFSPVNSLKAGSRLQVVRLKTLLFLPYTSCLIFVAACSRYRRRSSVGRARTGKSEPVTQARPRVWGRKKGRPSFPAARKDEHPFSGPFSPCYRRPL